MSIPGSFINSTAVFYVIVFRVKISRVDDVKLMQYWKNVNSHLYDEVDN